MTSRFSTTAIGRHPAFALGGMPARPFPTHALEQFRRLRACRCRFWLLPVRVDAVAACCFWNHRLTRVERPAVADLYGDGHAELLNVTNNDSAQFQHRQQLPQRRLRLAGHRQHVAGRAQCGQPAQLPPDQHHRVARRATVGEPPWTVTNGHGINCYRAVPSVH